MDFRPSTEMVPKKDKATEKSKAWSGTQAPKQKPLPREAPKKLSPMPAVERNKPQAKTLITQNQKHISGPTGQPGSSIYKTVKSRYTDAPKQPPKPPTDAPQTLKASLPHIQKKPFLKSLTQKEPNPRQPGPRMPRGKPAPRPKSSEDSEGDKQREKSTREDSASADKPARTKLDKKSMAKNASSYEDWKRRNRIPPNQKVFIVSSAIKDIKEALYRRGWAENPDQASPFFDFKWAIKSKDIVFADTLDFQIVNHFSKNTALTTKSGLAKALTHVNNFHDVDPDDFFPRCYNLEDQDQANDFLLDYRFSYVRTADSRPSLWRRGSRTASRPATQCRRSKQSRASSSSASGW